MEDKNLPGVNRPYVFIVSALTFFLPAISVIIEHLIYPNTTVSILFTGKWFIFYAVGVRLFMAGIRQTTKPEFTAKEIFHIDDASSLPVVRELGFANLCFGITGILSLFLPQWRIVSAFASGLYYGIAAVNHFIKKPAGANETFALITDVFIFIMLAIYFSFAFNWQ